MEKARKLIGSFNMLTPGDTVLVGVSGGADSVSLLILINELKSQYKISPLVVHVNHGIRGAEAERDQKFVKDLSAKLGLECQVFKYNVLELKAELGLSEEEAGRKARHMAFASALRGRQGVIALAHNSDDQAETVLFNLIRGSHMAGLRGMEPVSSLSLDGHEVKVIRPLLTTSRREIEAFLAAKNQDFVTDSTNSELVYSRNIIRREILPAMERVSEGARAHLIRLSEEAAELDDLIEARKREALEGSERAREQVNSKSKVTCQPNREAEVACQPSYLSIYLLKSLEPLVARSIMYDFIVAAAGGAKDITKQHVLEAMKLLDGQTGDMIILAGELKLAREYDKILVLKDQVERPAFGLEIRDGGKLVYRDYAPEKTDDCGQVSHDESLATSDDTSSITMDGTTTFTFPLKPGSFKQDGLKLRTICQEDTIRLFPGGGSKKLSKLLSDKKLPKAAAKGAMVLEDGEHVLAVLAASEAEGLYVRVDETIRAKESPVVLNIFFN